MPRISVDQHEKNDDRDDVDSVEVNDKSRNNVYVGFDEKQNISSKKYIYSENTFIFPGLVDAIRENAEIQKQSVDFNPITKIIPQKIIDGKIKSFENSALFIEKGWSSGLGEVCILVNGPSFNKTFSKNSIFYIERNNKRSRKKLEKISKKYVEYLFEDISIEGGASYIGGFFVEFGENFKEAAIFISLILIDHCGYDERSILNFENNYQATETVSVEVANSPHQEQRSGVPVSLVVILVLITALFASIFAFAWNSHPAGAGDAESVSIYVSGRANARDQPSAEGSSILGTYDVGTQLSGTWVNGATDANERWLKFEADGQTRYIWDGNLSAEAVSSSASSPPAAPAPPSLGTYIGKYPYDKLSGVSFWEHPAVVAQVEKLISSPAARGIILGGGVETPVAEAGAQGEYLFAFACEQHNCGSHNWSVAIKRDGTNASVCYYNADGGPIASANYDDTMEYTEAYEGCQLGD